MHRPSSRRSYLLSKRNIGAEILEGVEEVKQYNKGNVQLRTTALFELIALTPGVAINFSSFRARRYGGSYRQPAGDWRDGAYGPCPQRD